jgi:hypothetical protein
LSQIKKVVAPAADHTFVFGNDWGFKHLMSREIEPDYLTGFKSKSVELEIDTSRIIGFGKNLTLDFRNVAKELSFSIEKVAPGQIQLTVERSEGLPEGFEFARPTAWVDAFGGEIEGSDAAGVTNFLQDGLLGILTEFSFGTITFTHIDENTVIFGGRDLNTFAVTGFGTKTFPGKLIAGSGRRPVTESVLDPTSIQAMLGLELPRLTVSNTLAYETGIGLPIKPKPRVVNLGAPGRPKTAPGLLPGNLENIHNVTVGPGINVLLGSEFFDSPFSLGANVFTIQGEPILPLLQFAGVDPVVQNSTTALRVDDLIGTSALGMHVMAGSGHDGLRHLPVQRHLLGSGAGLGTARDQRRCKRLQRRARVL